MTWQVIDFYHEESAPLKGSDKNSYKMSHAHFVEQNEAKALWTQVQDGFFTPHSFFRVPESGIIS